MFLDIFGVLENAFLMSLAITVMLLIVLIYNFQQRIGQLEKRFEILYDLSTCMAKEINSMRQIKLDLSNQQGEQEEDEQEEEQEEQDDDQEEDEEHEDDQEEEQEEDDQDDQDEQDEQDDEKQELTIVQEFNFVESTEAFIDVVLPQEAVQAHDVMEELQNQSSGFDDIPEDEEGTISIQSHNSRMNVSQLRSRVVALQLVGLAEANRMRKKELERLLKYSAPVQPVDLASTAAVMDEPIEETKDMS
jgi:hypothetical protein